LLSTAFLSESTKVIAGEPDGAADAFQSWKTGQWKPMHNPRTIADGLLTSLGDKTWPIIRDRVERIITTSDEEIVGAMRLVWERMKIIIEPSCAVPLAALIAHKEEFKNQNIGIILTGGNVDLEKLPF
jgi:threonine dehydratase